MSLSAGCGWGRRRSDVDGSYEYVKQAVRDRPQGVVLKACSCAEHKTATFVINYRVEHIKGDQIFYYRAIFVGSCHGTYFISPF